MVDAAGGAQGDAPWCRAPLVAMEFDAFGDVQACCANALYPLGNVARSSLDEIWRGPRAEQLRTALAAGDLSYGCSVCHYRVIHGYGDLARDYYEHFPLPGDGGDWPFSLQFSLHNTCNLACVMCGADRSSKIRAQRSHLDPLPHVYGDAFFEQIVPYLEHAGAVDFSGGEPFLIAEHGRLWDLLIEMDRRPLCSLTTNGTVWNARTERVLAELDTHIAVSIDGMTPATFESIRVGARFDEVMANLDRFLAYTRERGTQLTLGWSLGKGNWRELGAAARFAEERGIHLKVHTVIEPEFGVQRLPTADLEHVVRSLEAEGEALLPQLELNRWVWESELGRLRDELELRHRPGRRALCMEPPAPGNVDHVAAMMRGVDDRRLPPSAHAAELDRSVGDLERWCSTTDIARIELDDDGTVRSGRLSDVLPQIDPDPADPGPAGIEDLLRSAERAFDGQLWVGEEWLDGGRLVHTLWIGRAVRDKVGLVLKAITVAHADGITLLVAVDPLLLERGPSGVPVSLTSRRPVPAATHS